MAVNCVTGGLGTGKSYFCVRKGSEALHKGRILVTNFRLEPDWAEQLVYGAPFGRQRRVTERRERKVMDLESRYLFVRDVDELMRVRVRREEPFVRWHKRRGEWVIREGSCIVILDEVHRWLNAREWANEDRKALVDWIRMTRKEGMEVYLISQSLEDVDAQLRRLCEDHTRLNNLRRSVRLLGFRVIPFDIFLAVTYNLHYPKEVARRDHYVLTRARHLYDSMDTLSFNERSDESIAPLWLPAGPADAGQDGVEGARSGASAPDAPPAPPAASAPPDDPAMAFAEAGESE